MCLALSACGGNNDTAGNTVTIGVVNTFGQGSQADSANNQFDGIQLGMKYVQEHGGLFNGATLRVVKGNENGEPATVATTVRKLVNNNVKLILGPALTPDCLAAQTILDQAGAIALIGCTTTSLTGPDRAGRNIYRWDTNDKITSTALGVVIANQFKDVQNVDVVAYDYLQGHEGWETFKNTLRARGITNFTTDHEFFVPSGTTNYSSQVGALAQTPKDGKRRILVLLTWGPGYLDFLKQAMRLGVLDNYAAVVTTSMYYVSAKALGGTAPKIYNSYGTCHADLWNNDRMAWLKREMLATHHRLPDDWSTIAFNQVLVMATAINKARSTDPEVVNQAMSTLEVDTATGRMTMDPVTHQARRFTPVCQTVGDPSAPEGVRLLGGNVLAPTETG